MPASRGSWEAAPAKINLYLHVVGRRPDGYHLLDSLVVFAGVGDVVRAWPDQSWSLSVIGPLANRLEAGEDNLVNRAAQALAARYGGDPARLLLEKHLPVAAGVGGGSADAAATLRLLARLWSIPDDLHELASQLGADVPVCLRSQPTRMAGIGEILTSAPQLPRFGLALVNPGVAVDTAAVFAAGAFRPREAVRLAAGWSSLTAMAADLARLRNDLEPPACRLLPAIADVLAALAGTAGCRLARMSGSGATCFGLYDDPASAAAAAASLARPGWWCWGGVSGSAEAAALSSP